MHIYTNIHAIKYNKNKSLKPLNKFHKLLARLARGRWRSQLIKIGNERKAFLAATAGYINHTYRLIRLYNPTETTDCKGQF